MPLGGKCASGESTHERQVLEIVEWRVDETNLKQGKREGRRLMICNYNLLRCMGKACNCSQDVDSRDHVKKIIARHT